MEEVNSFEYFRTPAVIRRTSTQLQRLHTTRCVVVRQLAHKKLSVLCQRPMGKHHNAFYIIKSDFHIGFSWHKKSKPRIIRQYFPKNVVSAAFPFFSKLFPKQNEWMDGWRSRKRNISESLTGGSALQRRAQLSLDFGSWRSKFWNIELNHEGFVQNNPKWK